jgi:hypothetical protein
MRHARAPRQREVCQAFVELTEHEPGISLTMLSTLGAQFRRLETQSAQP